MSLLVSYDTTDSEDNCDDDVLYQKPAINDNKIEADEHVVNNDKKDANISMGRTLPVPKNQEEMIILPSKKELALREKPPGASNKNKIVINLPKLENSDSEEEMGPPKKKLNYQTESSLLKSLPPPKFVPTKETNRPLIPHSVSKTLTVTQQQIIDDYEDEFDDAAADDVRKDMNFLLSWVDEENNALTKHESALYKYDENVDAYENQADVCSSYQQEASQPAHAAIPQDFARDEQFQKIMESQGSGDIAFLDVKLDDHLKKFEAERLREVTKGADAEGYSQKATSGLNPLSKRKHQITYLAMQAKEREFELKNQWAENKFNRRQTQSKYGF